jgi:S-formylglutathione hydrolase FrmB
VVVEGLVFPGEMPPLPEAAVAAVAETIGEPADSGARIIAIEELDARMVDLTIDSPAVDIQKVRLLLPAGFDPDADAGWPVLYLLHGAMDNYTSWTRETDIADLTADLDLLVVMPEGGDLGLYSDWWNAGDGGQPMWETFHLTELRELLERNWQAGDDRVIAGLSMGGFGAMSYAGRHPGMFKAAASFSGSVHPMDPGFYDIDPAVWGDRNEQVDIWQDHDPVSLAPALEVMPLYVSYGNGEIGPLDAADAGYDETEAMLAGHNETFVDRLRELDIAVTVDAYGPGTHTWPYWERGLHEALPMLAQAVEN